MAIKEKRKIVSIEPISNLAKFRFDNDMLHFHSCYVDSEDNDVLFLSSITKKYSFRMNKNNDLNWKIVK